MCFTLYNKTHLFELKKKGHQLRHLNKHSIFTHNFFLFTTDICLHNVFNNGAIKERLEGLFRQCNANAQFSLISLYIFHLAIHERSLYIFLFSKAVQKRCTSTSRFATGSYCGLCRICVCIAPST